VLEGAAYEMEIIRRAGERMLGRPIEAVTVAGGGARNRAWMQIKADVSGCEIEVSQQPEATLLGAALLVGVENGIYPDLAGSLAQTASARRSETFYPEPSRHVAYRELFVEGYSSLQSAVMKF
jgi:xylulokinase